MHFFFFFLRNPIEHLLGHRETKKRSPKRAKNKAHSAGGNLGGVRSQADLSDPLKKKKDLLSVLHLTHRAFQDLSSRVQIFDSHMLPLTWERTDLLERSNPEPGGILKLPPEVPSCEQGSGTHPPVVAGKHPFPPHPMRGSQPTRPSPPNLTALHLSKATPEVTYLHVALIHSRSAGFKLP